MPEMRDIWQRLGRANDALGYDLIGEEHLLLALLGDECPGAAPAVLASAGVRAAAVRADIIGRHGAPGAAEGASLHPACGYVLQRAHLKAIELRDERVSSEHALLALLEVPDSPVRALLSAAGIQPRSLEDRPPGAEHLLLALMWRWGRAILDEAGNGILTPLEVPAGVSIPPRSHPP